MAPALEAAVVKATAKVPADRFATAAEFAEALSAEAVTTVTPAGTPATVRSAGRRLWPMAAVALVAAGAGVAGWVFLRERGPAVPLSASVLAVLPFAPATGDTALIRLGRDLASTVSASLDGVGDIRTVDRLTVLAQTPEKGAVRSAP